MPLAVGYLAAAVVLVALELLLLIVALLMAPIPRFRPKAKCIALGVPGSFVGVFVFQLAALPIVLAMLWTLLFPAAYFHGGGQTTNPFVILVFICGFLGPTAVFALASLVGFLTGWRAANALGEGIALRAFLASDRVWQRVSILLRRPYRLPLLVWLMGVWAAFGLAALRWHLTS